MAYHRTHGEDQPAGRISDVISLVFVWALWMDMSQVVWLSGGVTTSLSPDEYVPTIDLL